MYIHLVAEHLSGIQKMHPGPVRLESGLDQLNLRAFFHKAFNPFSINPFYSR